MTVQTGIKALIAALVVVAPLAAQQRAATAPQTAPPTPPLPIRFTAVNQVSAGGGGAMGVTEILIERWSTPAERESLLKLVETAKAGASGQRKLLSGLEKIEPRAGAIRTPNSIGWDLRYAYLSQLPDGTRQIVIATDKPVSFAASFNNAEVLDYPFTFIEMRFPPTQGAVGEGRMLSAASITVKNNRLELTNYGNEPVFLTRITAAAAK
jgi:hypothetical protein